jgi:kinesin family protein 6/9
LVSRNEQADPGVIIQRLKREVQELKAELALLKGGEGVKEMLTSEDIDRCNKMVEDFISSSDPTKSLIIADRLMINQCFYHFKHLYKDIQKKKGGSAAITAGGPSGVSGGFGNMDMPSPQKGGDGDSKELRDMQAEMQRLNLLVQQRDNEIGILISHLNKKKGADGTAPGIPVTRLGAEPPTLYGSAMSGAGAMTFPSQEQSTP